MNSVFPTKLQRIINHKRLILESNKFCDLLPIDRVELYSHFGPLSVSLHEINQARIPTWHKLRGWLAILSAKQSLYIWEQHFDDKEPHQIIDMAQNILLGKINVENISDRFWNNLQFPLSEIDDETPAPVVLSGASVAEAMNMVIGLQPFSGYKLDEFFDDNFVNAGRGDGASAAVKAITKNLNLSSETELFQKRLEFWEWWLTEAIPQAWELAQNLKSNLRPI